MNAITKIFAVIIVIMVMSLSNAAMADTDILDKQTSQREAIYSGLVNGKITENELAELDREQYGIESDRRKYMRDGRLSRVESRRLETRMARAYRHINQACNNRSYYANKKHYRWNKRYDRYHHNNYWNRYYGPGYGSRHGNRYGHYKRRPLPDYHRRHRPYHHDRPYHGHRGHGGGRIRVGISQPGFGMWWSIGH